MKLEDNPSKKSTVTSFLPSPSPIPVPSTSSSKVKEEISLLVKCPEELMNDYNDSKGPQIHISSDVPEQTSTFASESPDTSLDFK